MFQTVILCAKGEAGRQDLLAHASRLTFAAGRQQVAYFVYDDDGEWVDEDDFEPLYLRELSDLAQVTGSPDEAALEDISRRHRMDLDLVRSDARLMRKIAVREAIRRG